MAFLSDLEADPLAGRIYAVLYGAAKIGKTKAVLDLADRTGKVGDYVLLISTDAGYFEARQNPKKYRGRLNVALIEDDQPLKEIREDLKAARLRVERLTRKGIDGDRIWVVLDTVTALQTKLLSEARRLNVHNPSSSIPRDEYIRDATTEVDYRVNLGHMNEVADALESMPCNVVVIAHEKPETIKKGRGKKRSDVEETGDMAPQLSGQAYNRFVGDADVVLRMTADEVDLRMFEPFVPATLKGGDRSGKLAEIEPASLKHIQRKMMGTPAEPALAPETKQPAAAEAEAG